MRRAVLGDEHVERAITRTTDFTVTQAVLGFTSEVKRSDTPTPSGPATVVSAGCTSGLDAVGHAADLIREGSADIMLAGGTDA
ncbi:beta-ketoacyl synthase N-terminal-like domain-containing protein, partial [Streptomyces sp. NPDC056358]|uniref:beta-ketoacyl synthase N-terminal-like domain-containing protein n=1 Tax=Streptomyces sp. NPDC056358 TaxID=3345794 RepID=UPI0035D6DE4A